jgi:hypothetical protein
LKPIPLLYHLLNIFFPSTFITVNHSTTQITSYLRLAAAIADLFTARFNPSQPLGDVAYQEQRQQLRTQIESDIQEDLVAKEVRRRR